MNEQEYLNQKAELLRQRSNIITRAQNELAPVDQAISDLESRWDEVRHGELRRSAVARAEERRQMFEAMQAEALQAAVAEKRRRDAEERQELEFRQSRQRAAYQFGK